MTSVFSSFTSFFGGSNKAKSRASYDSNSSFRDSYAGPSYLPRPPASRSASVSNGLISRTASFEEAALGGYSAVDLNNASSYPPQASHYSNTSYASNDAGLQSPNPSYPPPSSPFASPASSSRARLNGGPYIDGVPAQPAPTTSYPSVRQTFGRIEALLNPLYPELIDTLGYATTPEGFASLLDILGRVYTLPRDVRESLGVHDGQDIYSLASSASYRERQTRGMVWGLWLMSADEIADDYRHWRLLERKESRGEAAVDDPFANATRQGVSLPGMHSCPAGWVREEYSHPGWLPLLTDGLGNYVGVDLDPPATSALPNATPTSKSEGAWASLAGRPGQVIAFGREIDCKTVLFPGWGPDGGWARFLSSFADDLEAGEFGVLSSQRSSSGAMGVDDEDGEESFNSADGLGEVGYLHEGAGDLYESSPPSESKRGKRGRSSHEASGDGGWRLRGEYRDMGVIEALCARSRRRWAEVGLYGSDVQGRRGSTSRRPSLHQDDALSRHGSVHTVRPPSPQLIVVDPVKPQPLAAPLASISTDHLAEPSPLSPRLTLSPPSPQRSRSSGPSTVESPSPVTPRRRPPPPPAPLFLPTMGDLDGPEYIAEKEDDLEPITTASPRPSTERERRNSRQLPDVLPRSTRTPSPRPPAQAMMGLGIDDAVQVVISPNEQRPEMERVESGTSDYVDAPLASV